MGLSIGRAGIVEACMRKSLGETVTPWREKYASRADAYVHGVMFRGSETAGGRSIQAAPIS
jgi:hypothetical protein